MSDHLVFGCNECWTTEQDGEMGIFFPHYLRIVMDRGEAWQIFHALSHELMDERNTTLQVYIHGKMDKEEETK